jgi:aspartate/methionine/tyrosine aminotransferase
VYTGAERNGQETPSLFGEYPRVIATGSMSKAYGLPGLRVGWVVAPSDVAEQAWARTDYTTISPGELTDRLATLAFRDDVRPRILERTREYLGTGIGIMEEWLGENGFSWLSPEAGAICFAQYDVDINSTVLAERLRVDRSVLVVPGDHFGIDGYVRFGYGLPEPDLRTALGRVSETLDHLAKRQTVS